MFGIKSIYWLCNKTTNYESLNYNDKRVFPEGFKFSLKNKECRTSKVNMIIDLTNSFKENYTSKNEKTQLKKGNLMNYNNFSCYRGIICYHFE